MTSNKKAAFLLPKEQRHHKSAFFKGFFPFLYIKHKCTQEIQKKITTVRNTDAKTGKQDLEIAVFPY